MGHQRSRGTSLLFPKFDDKISISVCLKSDNTLSAIQSKYIMVTLCRYVLKSTEQSLHSDGE